MTRYKPLALLGLSLLLLGACVSAGDRYGDRSHMYEIRGTVDSVDMGNRSLRLIGINGGFDGRSSSARIYFNPRTPVDYQGRMYSPGNLERGDQIAVRVYDSGNHLVAESMAVLYDSSRGSNRGYDRGDDRGDDRGSEHSDRRSTISTLRGTVRSVDTARRVIELDSASWLVGSDRTEGPRSTMDVEYDTNVQVDYDNQQYPVTNLEHGDVVDVEVERTGDSPLVAQRILLVRDVNTR